MKKIFSPPAIESLPPIVTPVLVKDMNELPDNIRLGRHSDEAVDFVTIDVSQRPETRQALSHGFGVRLPIEVVDAAALDVRPGTD